MEAILGTRSRLLVRQTKEWGEILIGFEARNRFDILDETGAVVGHAAEEAGGFGAMLLRNLFGRCRACKVHLYDASGAPVGRGEKPFRLYFHRMEAFEGDRKLGAIQRRFSLLHRIFTIESADGRELLTIKSPFFRIWTFKLLLDGQEIGRIAKKWGGLLREAFSDADTFGVEFSHPKLPEDAKKLLLIAVFLIDFTCFENNTKGGTAFDVLSSGP